MYQGNGMLFGLEKLNSSKLPFGKWKFWVQLLKVFKVSFIIFKKKTPKWTWRFLVSNKYMESMLKRIIYISFFNSTYYLYVNMLSFISNIYAEYLFLELDFLEAAVVVVVLLHTLEYIHSLVSVELLAMEAVCTSIYIELVYY